METLVASSPTDSRVEQHAGAVRQLVTASPALVHWPECRQVLEKAVADTPSWILSLPLVSCLAAGGSPDDGARVAAGWLALNYSLHYLDAVEDGDFAPDDLVRSAPQALNFSTALLFLAYDFFSAVQSPGGAARVVKLCSECGFQAACGQHMGFDPGPVQVDQAVSRYWQATILKSGSLFRMGCAGGAAAGTGDAKLLEALGDFGTSIGVILQVLDDCRDVLDPDSGRCEASLPAFLYSAAAGSPEVIYPASRSGFQGTGVPETITNILTRWLQRAHDSLSPLEPSEAVDILKHILQIIPGA